MEVDEQKLTYVPSSNAFTAFQSANISKLLELSPLELRPFLPSLARLTATPLPDDACSESKRFQFAIRKKIYAMTNLDDVLNLLNVDFRVVHEDAVKEQHLRRKLGGIELSEDLLADSKGLLLEFEECMGIGRIRLVLGEVLRISANIQESPNTFIEDESELFECLLFIEELADVLCVAFKELPSLLSMPEVAEVLLRVKYGPELLSCLVANNPPCFDIVCSSILTHATNDECSNSEIRTRTLKMLCSMNDEYGKVLREECVSTRKLAGLAILISVNCYDSDGTSDLVLFFTGLLLASDAQTKDWATEYIRTSQKERHSNGLYLMKQQLIKEMTDVTLAIETKTSDLNRHYLHGIAIMRFYCALKTINGFKCTSEELEVLLKMVTCETTVCFAAVRYIIVSLCTLVSCSFLISSQKDEDKFVDWLRHLLSRSSIFQERLLTSYGETLLLIAIHFHNNTLEQVVDLVCATLGIKLRPGSLTKLKLLFTQNVFPEKVMAMHVLTVPFTQNLSANSKGFLPAHCIHQLMKVRTFTKHSIMVKDWLFNQLCCCTTPVHSLMLPLIETYVQSIVNSINIGKTTKQRHVAWLEPFSEQCITRVFTSDLPCADHTTTSLLLMTYLLIYQDVLLAHMKILVTTPNSPKVYSTLLYTTMPMKQLLLKSRLPMYKGLYPTLLRLLTTHYPHLCLPEDLLEEESLSENCILKPNTCQNISKEMLQQAFSMLPRSSHDAMIALNKLSTLHPDHLTSYVDAIVNALPLILDVSRKLQMQVASVWLKLNLVTPRSLWLKTVNILRHDDDVHKLIEYTDEDLKKDPLIVLRCDRKVFREPPIFELVLKVLHGYLAASRSLLTYHLSLNPVPSGNKSVETEREELKTTLIAAQESASLQILLEVCLPTEAEKKVSNYSVKSVLREIQCLVCCFLHQNFIRAPQLAKLIHFQGYPSSLLPVTCMGVPSMHICIDFIPEMLNQPHLEKQLFAVQLMSYLSLKYPIPKSFSTCKYTLQRCADLLAALPVIKRNQFFAPALKSLVHVFKSFPTLREDFVKLLSDVGKTANSQLTKVPVQVKTCNSKTGSCLGNCCQGDASEDSSNDHDDMGSNEDDCLQVYTSQQLADECAHVFDEVVHVNLTEKLIET